MKENPDEKKKYIYDHLAGFTQNAGNLWENACIIHVMGN